MNIEKRLRELDAFGDLYYASSNEWAVTYLRESEEFSEFSDFLEDENVRALLKASLLWVGDDPLQEYRHPHEMLLVMALEILRRRQPVGCLMLAMAIQNQEPRRMGAAYEMATRMVAEVIAPPLEELIGSVKTVLNAATVAIDRISAHFKSDTTDIDVVVEEPRLVPDDDDDFYRRMAA